MNPNKAIQELNFGDTTNRLLSKLINTDKVDTNLYIGTIEIVPEGEPNFNQLPWIPRKIEKLQKLTGEIHDTAMDFSRIANLAKEIEESTQKSFPMTSLYREFRSADFSIKKLLNNLKVVLKDMENALDSIDYPSSSYVKNLYKINEKSSSLIIKEQDRVDYAEQFQKSIGKLLESPMHYFLLCVSEVDGTAFVSRGYKIAPLVGAGYHEIWGDIHDTPQMINSECVWRS